MKLTEELRKALRVRVDYTNMTDKYLGDKGISAEDARCAQEDSQRRLTPTLQKTAASDELFMGWTELPYNQDEIVADILEHGKAGPQEI